MDALVVPIVVRPRAVHVGLLIARLVVAVVGRRIGGGAVGGDGRAVIGRAGRIVGGLGAGSVVAVVHRAGGDADGQRRKGDGRANGVHGALLNSMKEQPQRRATVP